MHIITRKRLNEFAEKYPNTQTALARWYEIAEKNDFDSFADLRRFFPSADQVRKYNVLYTVFNVGGNKVRLITAIHYNRKKIFIRGVLTHKEYNLSKWNR